MAVHRTDAIPGKFKTCKAKKATATPGKENPNAARTIPGAENPNAARTIPGAENPNAARTIPGKEIA